MIARPYEYRKGVLVAALLLNKPLIKRSMCIPLGCCWGKLDVHSGFTSDRVGEGEERAHYVEPPLPRIRLFDSRDFVRVCFVLRFVVRAKSLDVSELFQDCEFEISCHLKPPSAPCISPAEASVRSDPFFGLFAVIRAQAFLDVCHRFLVLHVRARRVRVSQG